MSGLYWKYEIIAERWLLWSQDHLHLLCILQMSQLGFHFNSAFGYVRTRFNHVKFHPTTLCLRGDLDVVGIKPRNASTTSCCSIQHMKASRARMNDLISESIGGSISVVNPDEPNANVWDTGIPNLVSECAYLEQRKNEWNARRRKSSSEESCFAFGWDRRMETSKSEAISRKPHWKMKVGVRSSLTVTIDSLSMTLPSIGHWPPELCPWWWRKFLYPHIIPAQLSNSNRRESSGM